MTATRVGVALAVCGFILVAQVLQCIFERDDWPLSSYPMYSWLQPRVVERFAVVGVTPEGEHALSNDDTKPLGGARLRAVLSKNATSAAKLLAPDVCKNLKEQGKPDISSLRIYRNDWRINPQLKGMDERGKLRAALPVVCPDRLAALAAQQKESGVPLQTIAAPPGSVVLEAESARLGGEAIVVDDSLASNGKTVLLNGETAEKDPLPNPDTHLRVEFKAAAGDYYLWVRTKATAAADSSVWVQLNEEIGSDSGLSLSDLARPAPQYPKDVYAWGSNEPGHKPAKLRLPEAATHELVISTRRGSISLDQIGLVPVWSEHPLHNLPLSL